jgi:hypothetical protein
MTVDDANRLADIIRGINEEKNPIRHFNTEQVNKLSLCLSGIVNGFDFRSWIDRVDGKVTERLTDEATQVVRRAARWANIHPAYETAAYTPPWPQNTNT